MSKSFVSKSAMGPAAGIHPGVASLNLEDSEQTLAFVAASPDTEYAETVRGLRNQFPVPMIGGTSLGNPFDPSNEPFGTTVGFLGKKDVKRAVVLSEPVATDRDNSVELANDLVSRAMNELGAEPKLFIVCVPITPDLFADHLMAALYKAAGSVPVFGTMVSDDFNSDRSAVFFRGECRPDRIALAALGGGIDPVFAVGRELTYPSKYSPVITDGGGNVIRRVDDMTFAEYIGKYDLDTSAIEECPVSIRMRVPGKEDEDGNFVITDLVKLEEDGSGVFSNTVIPGGDVTLCCVTRENVENSARACLDKLTARMKAKTDAGYSFGMVLAMSCIARYYVVARGARNAEAELLAAALPEDIGRFGMFAFAEYCPVQGEDGGLVNKTHSQTLVMCAF